MKGGNYYPYETSAGVRWRCVWRTSDSKSQSKSGFESEDAAEGFLIDTLHAVRRGVALAGPKATVAELWPEFLERKRGISEGTRAGYERNGRLHICSTDLGRTRVGKVARAHIEDWLDDLVEAEKLSTKTINNNLMTVRSFFTWCARMDYIARNPAEYVEALDLELQERDYLRRSEIPRYLEACSPVYRPLAELLIATGMRISEALALKWSDIDFDTFQIRVYRSRKAKGTGKTKGKKFRAVDLGPRLEGVLLDMRAVAAERIAEDPMNALVFMHDEGRWGRTGEYVPMDRNTTSRDWHKSALKAAGLRDMPLHSLRHTAASVMLAAGKGLPYVTEQLGHGSYSTTVQFYRHFEQSGSRRRAADVEALVWGEPARV